MNFARWAHTATSLPSGNVLVAGGTGDSGFLNSAEVYIWATNQWINTNPMGLSHVDHTATLLTSGKVLVAGGYTCCSGSTGNLELYDPANNSWSSAGYMIDARQWHAATLLPNGTTLMTGGVGLASAEVVDPASNPWSFGGRDVLRHGLPRSLCCRTAECWRPEARWVGRIPRRARSTIR